MDHQADNRISGLMQDAPGRLPGEKVTAEETSQRLTPYVTPAGAWALSLGTSIGWGSLVITSSTYLSQAGPMGSTLGMLAGALIMLIISRNYHYMMDCFPDAGGVYAYARETHGYDHGFLAAWFLGLTYLAVLWANATSLPLFARYFIGNIFRVGFLYTIFGYDVYLGEAVLAVTAILLIAFLCARKKKITAGMMVGMVGFFTAGITICFLGSVLRRDVPFEPAYIPDKSAVSQIIKIACISPWAFIGFENISHAAEEFTFPKTKTFRILIAAVISTTLLYIFVILLSVTAYPPEYENWLSYIRDHGNLEGLRGLPAFYAADHYMGSFGVGILILSLLALVLTSLIGNILALSRLFYALARDRILPERFAKLNDRQIPANAIGLIVLLSLVMPFLGRTAIGWIVDVTTIGATLVYGFVSASALKMAKLREDKREELTGRAGLIIMIGFGIYLLVPNLFTTGSMARETYFLFVVWAVLGFFYFRFILHKDQSKRFGKSIIVWIALLSLVLFVSLVWMSQSTMQATAEAIEHIRVHYDEAGYILNDGFIAREMSQLRYANAKSIIVVVVLFAIALSVLLNNYSIMSRRAHQSEAELGHMVNLANTDQLTGVKNKRAFAEKEAEVTGKMSEGGEEAFSIVVCDVNGLKYVNDTYGHKAGDEYIRSASAMICELYQHSPVYRVGGDEFAVFLRGRDHERRQEILDMLNQRVEENIGTGRVVVSAGMSDLVPGKDKTMHDVFERADALMYRRKQQLKAMGAVTRT